LFTKEGKLVRESREQRFNWIWNRLGWINSIYEFLSIF
jgi:hypothetical protein